jgi:two-component system, LuxR family, sensor kinase FixL
VRDFGAGLPTGEPRRVFKRFYSTKRDGMGMGLAIARSIVTSHGGELAATNAQGGGAYLYFLLPVNPERQEDEEQLEIRREDKQHERTGTAHLRGR